MKIRKFLSVLLVVSLVLLLPMSALGAENIGGSCGDTLNWTLSGGKLTISGQGSMENYNSWINAPWWEYRNEIRSLEIGPEVTSVGSYAFYGCAGLTTVVIPAGVTSIGNYGFYECTGLTDVVVGDGVGTIGISAFAGCAGLVNVTLGDGVEKIDLFAFNECGNLASIYFEGDAPTFGIPLVGEVVFQGVTASAYYPKGNATWNSDVKKNYGGTITWVPYGTCRHEAVMEGALDAACTAPGYTGDSICAICGDVLMTGEEIPALGHDYQATVMDPTCTEQGYTIHTCIRCGDSYTDSYMDALEHSYEAIVTAPGCEQRGYTTHTCTLCGSSYIDSYVDALEHNYVSQITAPTCTEQGCTIHTCTLCGDSYQDTFLDALGHSYTEWAITAEPDCMQAGSEQRGCTVCGHGELREIPALGHDYISEVTEPGCIAGGYTTHTCSRCADAYVDSETEPTGHTWGQWTVVTERTCTEAGQERRDCEHCIYYETKEIPPRDHSYVDGICEHCGQEEPLDFLPGDVNGDGNVDNVDAMLVLRYAVGLAQPEELNLDAADVNGDGSIDNVDAMRILRFAVGLEDLTNPQE